MELDGVGDGVGRIDWVGGWVVMLAIVVRRCKGSGEIPCWLVARRCKAL